MSNLSIFETHFFHYIKQEMQQDPAHDVNHVKRVVKMAKQLCDEEEGVKAVVVPAAYLHDCFSFAKNHPNRSQSSLFAADKAVEFLTKIEYPSQYYEDIHHAIVAHSYSAKLTPTTLEAKIVQDADRLDALGAIGIVRCLQVGMVLNRPFYSVEDPFCSQRELDDSLYTLDHFYTKLLKLEETMNTFSARREAEKRTAFMKAYLAQLSDEIS